MSDLSLVRCCLEASDKPSDVCDDYDLRQRHSMTYPDTGIRLARGNPTECDAMRAAAHCRMTLAGPSPSSSLASVNGI
jgi:hypothetical protein